MSEANDSSHTIDDATLDDYQLLLNLLGCLPLLLAGIVFFDCLRRRHRHIFAVNYLVQKEEDRKRKRIAVAHNREFVPARTNVVNPSHMSLLHLVSYLWNMKDDEIRVHIGVDGLAFIRLLWMMVEVTAICFPVGMFILAPIYSSGGAKALKNQTCPQFTIGNVKQEDWRLWAVFFAAWFTFFVASWHIQACFRLLARYADRFHTRDDDAAYTVMITNVAKEYSDEDKLMNLMISLFGEDHVHHVLFAHDIEKIWPTWELFDKYCTKHFAAQREHQGQGMCCWAESEETIKRRYLHYKAKLDAQTRNDEPLRVAFVFFNTLKAAVLCATSALIPNRDKMKVSKALEEDDIQWQNLGIPRSQRKIATMLVTLCYILLILYFTPLMIAIQALANLDTIAANWSSFEEFLEYSETMRVLLTGLIPVLIYGIFFLLLPLILHKLVLLQKHRTRSRRDSSTLKKHTDCLIGVGLLVTFLASGILQDVNEINDLSTWFDTLGENMPRNSTFFISLMCLAGIGGISLELTQLGTFFKFCFSLPLHRDFDFYIYTPSMMFYFAVMLTYIPIAPLILIPSLPFFLSAYLVYLYQLIFVYKKPYDAGARTFPDLYSRLYWGIIISQAVLIGFFMLKKGYYQTPCLVLTLFYTLNQSSKQGNHILHAFQNESLKSANDVDKLEARQSRAFEPHAYKDPITKYIDTKGSAKPEVHYYLSSHEESSTPGREPLLTNQAEVLTDPEASAASYQSMNA